MAMYEKLFFTFCAGLVVIALNGSVRGSAAELPGKVDEATEGGKKVAEATEQVGKKVEEATEQVAGNVEAVGDPEAGKKMYSYLCSTCHGRSGRGVMPGAAATLGRMPPRHVDGEYMNALTDQYLFKVIKEGGAGVGKSPQMLAWGGQLNDQDIWNLVSYVRTLANPPYKPPK
jgi:mono/diheme cytochrome c family protein